jgi:cell division protein FtsI (penicillin-binding protein 3)
LMGAIQKFQAVAANAMVMDLRSGEMLAMVSLPDFDPNQLNGTPSQAIFNRNTLGVYEPGSTFKILNIAIALESGHATLGSIYDARAPVKLGRFSITDFKGKGRFLNLTEAFVYSSNIAAIKIAQQFGVATQKEYMKKFGVLDAVSLEIPEIGQPIIPQQWREPTLMTMSYGYGISVSPLQVLSTVSRLIKDGRGVNPTLMFKSDEERAAIIEATAKQEPIISAKTSQMLRELMRTAVQNKARMANIEGYNVFGKTGTAYKIKGKSYDTGKSRTTSFVGAFPLENPQYMLVVMLDDPKATKDTYSYATAGWNAAPTAGDIIKRIAPLLGLHPMQDSEHLDYVKPLTQEGFVKTNHVVAD